MSDWRCKLPVLVAEAQALGSVGVIRSLGHAGYPVVAVSHESSAIGLRSRFAAKALVCPAYNSSQFVPWLKETIAGENVKAIIPSEGFLHAIRPQFAEFAALLPLSKEASVVYSSLSKFDLLQSFQRSGLNEHLPRSDFVGEGSSTDINRLESLGYPLFLKFDAAYARGDSGNRVVRIENRQALEVALPALLDIYQKGVMQGYCPGVGVGAFLLRWRGEELAYFMHRRLHEVPHTGGASSYREAWYHAEIMADARARAKYLDWEGVAMFEYRWDPATDEFWLMEVNARFWGSIHLALFAGVDFPCLLLDAFFGYAERCDEYDHSVRCRWTFPREVEYVISCARDPSLPLYRRLWPILEFFLLGLDPRIRSDLLYPGDRRLYARAMFRTLQQLTQ